MIDDPLIGYQVGNYRVERVIGRGGMAQVYYGWDLSLHRPVAIKVIDTRFRGNPSYAQRFVQEARAVATWRHENILQVYYAGQEEGLFYFAMEFIDGLDLGQILADYARDKELMPQEDVLRVGRAVADALDYAHHKKVIHRDVKPSNVMIARDGRVVLADFGLAMDTQQGSLGETFGTPHYVAPEQARNSSQAVAASDLYSLGIILYEMLVGQVPFDDPSATSLAIQHITAPPPPPRSVNPALNEATEAVLLKALSKKAEDRQPSGRVLMNELEKALQEPAGETAVGAPAVGATATRRTISAITVAERVSKLEMPPPPPADLPAMGQLTPALKRPSSGTTPPTTPTDTNPAPATVAPPATPPPARGGAVVVIGNTTIPLMALVGGGIGGLVLVVILFAVLLNMNKETAVDPTGTAVVTSVVEVTEVAATEVAVVVETAPVLQPTAVAPTVAVESPTIASPDTPTAVVAIVPTDAPVIVPTDVPVVVEPTVAGVPTVLYPNGRHIQLYYDAYSFYLLNLASANIGERDITFEALDAAGNPTGNTFVGSNWTQFYSFVEPNSCVRIETTRAPSVLRPTQCRNKYNSTVTPQLEDPMVFWFARGTAVEFRVLWTGAEVGRCQFATSPCDIYLP